jgi:hypothetical protein
MNEINDDGSKAVQQKLPNPEQAFVLQKIIVHLVRDKTAQNSTIRLNPHSGGKAC